MILFNPTMETEKLAVIGLVIIIVVGLSVYIGINEGLFENKESEEEDQVNPITGGLDIGDCADVDYTGRFQVNNSVFDTSIEDIAKEAGIYDEERFGGYVPLKIFINPNGDLTVPEEYSEYTSNMLPGFINGLVGMEEGETKTVILPPEEAYGTWNESQAIEYGVSPSPLDQEMDAYQTENITSFQGYFPDVTVEEGVVFDYGKYGFEIEGVFNATITNVSDGNLTYKLTPEDGTTFLFPYFDMNVTFTIVNDTTLNMRQHAEVGHIFSIPTYWGSYIHLNVTAVNDTHANYSINIQAPELKFVDQTLIFELTVIKGYETSDQLES